jgi:hypothetical protein
VRLRCFRESFGLPLQLREFRAAHGKSQRALVRERSEGTQRRYLDCIKRELFIEIVERNRLEIEYPADRQASAKGRMVSHCRRQMPRFMVARLMSTVAKKARRLTCAARCDGRTEDHLSTHAGQPVVLRGDRGRSRAGAPPCSCQKETFSEMVRMDALAASFRLAYCTTSRSTRVASCCSRWRNACSSAMK